MFCNACGSRNEESSNFCSSCGKSLDSAKAAVSGNRSGHQAAGPSPASAAGGSPPPPPVQTGAVRPPVTVAAPPRPSASRPGGGSGSGLVAVAIVAGVIVMCGLFAGLAALLSSGSGGSSSIPPPPPMSIPGASSHSGGATPTYAPQGVPAQPAPQARVPSGYGQENQAIPAPTLHLPRRMPMPPIAPDLSPYSPEDSAQLRPLLARNVELMSLAMDNNSRLESLSGPQLARDGDLYMEMAGIDRKCAAITSRYRGPETQNLLDAAQGAESCAQTSYALARRAGF